MSASVSSWIQRDGMLSSPLLESLGLVAGFTTRAQGSMGGTVYPLEEQARNRAAVARRLGFAEVVRLKQVHGNEVVHLDAPREPWPVADAMWTDRPGVLLGIAAADCVPILIADRRSGLIGAGHAGWQGTRLRVAEALTRALLKAGADPSALVASLGPSIGPCCYSIDEQRAALVRESGQGDHLLEGPEGTRFDLWSANAAQLRAAGVRTIETAGLCTKSGGADLWSYRARDRDGRYGTQLGFIGRRA
jgi:YfiH family protein